MKALSHGAVTTVVLGLLLLAPTAAQSSGLFNRATG